MIILRKYDDLYWQRLDNVARLFASTTTYQNPNLYRMVIKLKDNIDGLLLSQALNMTLAIMPTFNVSLKRGLFWYYFEKNNLTPVVEEDNSFPYFRINVPENNNFLFKVSYIDSKINIDVAHALTDGTGALHFSQTLILNYLKLKYPKKINADILDTMEPLSKKGMSSDSFLRYVNKNHLKDKPLLPGRGYNIQGTKLNDDEMCFIVGTLSVSALKKLAKEKKTTLTVYIAACLIQAIYEENYQYHKIKKPVKFCIPINLRNYFASTSMNNFFTTVQVGIDFSKKAYTFDDIIEEVDNQLKTLLDKEKLSNTFKLFVDLQQNAFLRFIPLFIKDFFLKIGMNTIGNNNVTALLTNIGAVNFPEEAKNYIDKFILVNFADKSLPFKMSMCSNGDKISLVISSSFVDTDIQRNFFTFFTKQGLDVTISYSMPSYDLKKESE